MKQILVGELNFTVKDIPQVEMNKVREFAEDTFLHSIIFDKYITPNIWEDYEKTLNDMASFEVEEFKASIIKAAIGSMSSSRDEGLHKVAVSIAGRLNRPDEFFALDKILSILGYKYKDIREYTEFDKWDIVLYESMLKIREFDFTNLLEMAIGDNEELNNYLNYYKESVSQIKGESKPSANPNFEDDEAGDILAAIESEFKVKAGEF